MMGLGPELPKNKIFQLMKTQSDFVSRDIVSIYRSANDKNVRMQIGGFEESFARGMKNGILFY